jgi:hypothetical protein
VAIASGHVRRSRCEVAPPAAPIVLHAERAQVSKSHSVRWVDASVPWDQDVGLYYTSVRYRLGKTKSMPDYKN